MPLSWSTQMIDSYWLFAVYIIEIYRYEPMASGSIGLEIKYYAMLF